MCALDAPFTWIEVIGSVAYVLAKAQGNATVCEKHKAFWRILRQSHRLTAQKVDGGGIIHSNKRKQI